MQNCRSEDKKKWDTYSTEKKLEKRLFLRVEYEETHGVFSESFVRKRAEPAQ